MQCQSEIAYMSLQMAGRCKVWQAAEHEDHFVRKQHTQGSSGGLQWGWHLVWLDGAYCSALGSCQGAYTATRMLAAARMLWLGPPCS